MLGHLKGPRSRALAIATAVLVVVGGQGIASADANTPTLMFGAYVAARNGLDLQGSVEAMEARLGRPLAAVRVFDLWDQPFPSDYDTWLRDTGHTLFLSVRSKRVNGSNVLWRSIADAQPGSALYTEIVGWATRVRDFGAPIYFIFNHEPEAAASDPMGSATDFIDAWRKIVTVFRDQGVTNAKYTWTMTDYAFWRTDGGRAPLWYPGDAYVDKIASDAYNWSNCRAGINTPWRSLSWIAGWMRDFGAAHPDKGLILTEWASHEDPTVPGRKASWINDVQQFFKQPGWEQFEAILYYHQTLRPSCTFWLDSSASSMAAITALANDPFFGRYEGTPDAVPPSAPGRPDVRSDAPGEVTLEWQAATDDVASTLLYRVYRDEGTTPVGTVSSAATGVVSFTDTDVPPGIHRYAVSASDGVNEGPRSPDSADVLVAGPSAIFSDDFAGGLGGWTSVSGITLDAAIGSPSAPSARAATVAARAWASEVLPGTYPSICASARVLLGSTVDGASLLRLRTAADGPIVRVFISPGRALSLRSDVSGGQLASTSLLPIGSWTTLELCGTVGAAGQWTLYRDGVAVLGPWTANTGTTGVGRITIGTPDPRTIAVNFDDVVVDGSPG